MRWLRRGGARDDDVPTDSGADGVVGVSGDDGVVAEADPATERRQLIELLIYAWDRARSDGVRERLTAGLAEVGVTVVRPDGEVYDPSAHEVGGTETTDAAALVDTVAETELVGFTDRDTVIREPIVVVYRSD